MNNFRLSIDDYIRAWNANKSISFACDLISAAYVNNFSQNRIVLEAANYLLKNKKGCPDSALNLATMVVSGDQFNSTTNETGVIFEESFNIDKYRKLIKKYRNKINEFPYNPILYVDLSRLYSILGIPEKAIKNMKIALNLSPNNRFILRAASRLFVHYQLPDYVHDILKKSDLIKRDPWIISTEIALSTIMNKSSKFIKDGLHLINSQNYSDYNISELAASIGTVEFLNGHMNKAKKMFRKTLNSPNDNSLAQIEWINTYHSLFPGLNPSAFNIKNNFEALAFNNYSKYDYVEALKNIQNWFSDLPFSKRSVLFGSYIAGSLLGDTKTAIKLLKDGLKSQPNDAQLINNLSYSLALENNYQEAEKVLTYLDKTSSINSTTIICLKATWGLILFRKGNFAGGQKYYEDAIRDAYTMQNQQLIWLAKLNYARELIFSKFKPHDFIVNFLDIPNNTSFRNVDKLKNDVQILLSMEKQV